MLPVLRSQAMRVHWADNDPLFYGLLSSGHGWQALPYAYFRQHGLNVEMAPFGFRESIAQAGEYRDTVDLRVNGVRVEVKSRPFAFTSMSDWPDDRLPPFVDTVAKYDDRAEKPLAYVFVSQQTGAMLCTDGRLCASRTWGRVERLDSVRGIPETFYTVKPSSMRTMDRLLEVLGRPALTRA